MANRRTADAQIAAQASCADDGVEALIRLSREAGRGAAPDSRGDGPLWRDWLARRLVAAA